MKDMKLLLAAAGCTAAMAMAPAAQLSDLIDVANGNVGFTR